MWWLFQRTSLTTCWNSWRRGSEAKLGRTLWRQQQSCEYWERLTESISQILFWEEESGLERCPERGVSLTVVGLTPIVGAFLCVDVDFKKDRLWNWRWAKFQSSYQHRGQFYICSRSAQLAKLVRVFTRHTQLLWLWEWHGRDHKTSTTTHHVRRSSYPKSRCRRNTLQRRTIRTVSDSVVRIPLLPLSSTSARSSFANCSLHCVWSVVKVLNFSLSALSRWHSEACGVVSLRHTRWYLLRKRQTLWKGQHEKTRTRHDISCWSWSNGFSLTSRLIFVENHSERFSVCASSRTGGVAWQSTYGVVPHSSSLHDASVSIEFRSSSVSVVMCFRQKVKKRYLTLLVREICGDTSQLLFTWQIPQTHSCDHVGSPLQLSLLLIFFLLKMNQ